MAKERLSPTIGFIKIPPHLDCRDPEQKPIGFWSSKDALKQRYDAMKNRLGCPVTVENIVSAARGDNDVVIP